LQGASADLGPREGFVGDPQVADRNGRQLGYAALSVLESLPPPGTSFVYCGPVISGATIGTWRHEPQGPAARESAANWQFASHEVALSYRPELPSLEQTRAELARWQAAEAAATGETARDCHAQVERMTRQLWKLQALPAGPSFGLRYTLARLGDALWLFLPGEHYQSLQVELRRRFPERPIVVATIADGWQPGYVPPADTYGRGIYQEQIAVVAAGSAEAILNAVGQTFLSAG
jgi:hypothetical protein